MLIHLEGGCQHVNIANLEELIDLKLAKPAIRT